MADMVICPAKVPIYLPFMLFGFGLHYNIALYLHCAFNFKAIYPHNSSPGIGNKNQVVVFLFLWRRKLRLHHHISISFFQGCSLKRQEYRTVKRNFYDDYRFPNEVFFLCSIAKVAVRQQEPLSVLWAQP